jgi:hypothetical protein
LSHLHGPVEALLRDRTTAADGLRLVDLLKRRTAVGYGEEKLGIYVQASCPFTPLHGMVTSFGSQGKSAVLSCKTGQPPYV